MRVMAAVLFATVAFQVDAVAFAEGVDEQRGDEAPVPYNRHQDPHHGHNHVYPSGPTLSRMTSADNASCSRPAGSGTPPSTAADRK